MSVTVLLCGGSFIVCTPMTLDQNKLEYLVGIASPARPLALEAS